MMGKSKLIGWLQVKLDGGFLIYKNKRIQFVIGMSFSK